MVKQLVVKYDTALDLLKHANDKIKNLEKIIEQNKFDNIGKSIELSNLRRKLSNI